MKTKPKPICALMVLLFSLTIIRAQTPSDAVMMKPREACFAFVYDHGSWDQYWEGTTLRSNETVATLKRNTMLTMIAIGIFDRVNIIISAPYVSTKSAEPNGGRFKGQSGFQDFGAVIKGELIRKEIGSGKLSVLGVIGYSTPMTNYLSDYRPYSIGSGTNELSVRAISQYTTKSRFYFRAAVAYTKRGQTKAERDYYYNNGSYYTSWMDVPDALDVNVVGGKWFLENSLKVELNYVGIRSTSGDDIRKYNAGQPTNKVDFDQVGISSQYYLKKIKGLGVLGYCSQIINGRNMGKFFNVGVGLTYQFKV